MSSTITFIYCFDENYNTQAATSILSLLRKVNKEIDITIIHKNKKSFKKYLNIISREKFLRKIKVFDFNLENIAFPNLTNKHISEATYYRLFIDEVIDCEHSLGKVVYIDSDIICLNNPLNYINDYFIDLEDGNFLLGAKTDSFDEKYNFKYFNAGVLIFDYSQWIQNNIFESLRKILYQKEINFQYWDQDVLNYFFKGNYKEIDETLNFEIEITEDNRNHFINEKPIFVHYLGNKKPWHVSNLVYKNTHIYQEVFSSIFDKKYFLLPDKFNLDLYGFFSLYKKEGVKIIFNLSLVISFFSIFRHHIIKKFLQ